MILCLAEPPVRFFLMLALVFHFVVVVHSFPGYLAMPPAFHPCFSGPWRPSPALSSTLATFDCLCFFIYCRCYGFEWAFFTHRCFFTLRCFPKFLIHPGFVKASLGAGSSSLKLAGLHADPQNTNPAHLLIWFIVIQKLHIQKNSLLNSIINIIWNISGKSLVYLLLTRFELFSLVQIRCKDY